MKQPRFSALLTLLVISFLPIQCESQLKAKGIENAHYDIQGRDDRLQTSSVRSPRELFWASDKHLPAWREYKRQQRRRRRRQNMRRRRRRRSRNGTEYDAFRAPDRWSGNGFMKRGMRRMKKDGVENTIGSKMKMKMGKPDGNMMKPVKNGGMMRPTRPMKMDVSEGESDQVIAGPNGKRMMMKLTWSELRDRRRNMRMRETRRWKRRQMRMRQRRRWKLLQDQAERPNRRTWKQRNDQRGQSQDMYHVENFSLYNENTAPDSNNTDSISDR